MYTKIENLYIFSYLGHLQRENDELSVSYSMERSHWTKLFPKEIDCKLSYILGQYTVMI